MNFISEHWSIIVGLAAATAYIIEKITSYLSESKKKKEAYNRFFVGLIKFYYSYLKHKTIYQEKAIFNVPDEQFMLLAKTLDTFNEDIKKFVDILNIETEIIPEISLQTHSFFDTIERYKFLDSSSFNELIPMTDHQKLVAKRAHFHALDDFFNTFFDEIIPKIRKKTTVKEDFEDDLFYLNTEDYERDLMEQRIKLIVKYLESMNRQGEMPDEVLNEIRNNLFRDNTMY